MIHGLFAKLGMLPTLDRVLTMADVLGVQTEEKQRMAGHLQENLDRYRLLVEGIKDYAIVLLDPQGRVTSWNPGAQRIRG